MLALPIAILIALPRQAHFSRLIELPFVKVLRKTEAGFEALFENVSLGTSFASADFSWDGSVANLTNVEYRVQDSGSLGEWHSIVTTVGTGAECQSIGDIRLAHPTSRLDLRVRLKSVDGRRPPMPRLVCVALADPTSVPAPEAQVEADHDGWGKSVKWPNSPRVFGPTPGPLDDLAVITGFWRIAAGNPNLPEAPSDLAIGWDLTKNPSTGDRTRMAGSYTGVISYTTFLAGYRDLEAWAELGMPILCHLQNGTRGATNWAMVLGIDAKGNPLVDENGKTVPMDRKEFGERWNATLYETQLVHPGPLGTPATDAPARWLNKEHDG